MQIILSTYGYLMLTFGYFMFFVLKNAEVSSILTSSHVVVPTQLFSTQKAPTFGHIWIAATEIKTWNHQRLLINTDNNYHSGPFCPSVLIKQLCIKVACNFLPVSRLTSVRKQYLIMVLYEFQNCNYRVNINLH